MSNYNELYLGEEVIDIIKQLHKRDIKDTEKDILYTIMGLVALREEEKNEWKKPEWKKYFMSMKALAYLLRSEIKNSDDFTNKNVAVQTEQIQSAQPYFTPGMLALRQIGNVQPEYPVNEENQKQKKQKTKKRK